MPSPARMSLMRRSTRRSARSQIKKTLDNVSKLYEEEQRLVSRRSGLRIHFQRTLDKALDYLKEENVDKAKLLSYKRSLENLVEQLEALDNEVIKVLDKDKVEEDVVESLEFLEPVNDVVSSIEVKLSQLDLMVSCPPSVQAGSVSSVSNFCRLPKMDLPTFQGDPLKWQGFWDQFQVSIHDNERISDIDRFNFLKKYLRGEALNAVSGLNLNAENYKEAVALLMDRYGNEQILISAHMESLLKIPRITSKNNIKGLRDLYNHVESCVRNLRSLKLETNVYGSLLIPILKQKLPDELTILISRKFGSSVWTFEKVLEYFNEELRAQENCSSNVLIERKESEGYSKPPAKYTARFDLQHQNKLCVYCKSEAHSAARCRTVTNTDSRREIVKKEGRCFICLSRGHKSRHCNSKYKCNKCNS